MDHPRWFHQLAWRGGSTVGEVPIMPGRMPYVGEAARQPLRARLANNLVDQPQRLVKPGNSPIPPLWATEASEELKLETSTKLKQKKSLATSSAAAIAANRRSSTSSRSPSQGPKLPIGFELETQRDNFSFGRVR
jgi:hypothetical protein